MNLGFQWRLEFSLLMLRLSVFFVMLFWDLDKFIRVDHAKGVFENFYFIVGLESPFMKILAFFELGLIIFFLLGVMKRFTYGLVLLLHALSTFSSFHQYLEPFVGSNLLFFAAWPMLGACLALYLLRDYDNRFTMGHSLVVVNHGAKNG